MTTAHAAREVVRRNNLTPEERERFAYIAGDVQTAAIFDEAEKAAAEASEGYADALQEVVDFMAARRGAIPKKALVAAIRRYLDDPQDVSLTMLLDDI